MLFFLRFVVAPPPDDKSLLISTHFQPLPPSPKVKLSILPAITLLPPDGTFTYFKSSPQPFPSSLSRSQTAPSASAPCREREPFSPRCAPSISDSPPHPETGDPHRNFASLDICSFSNQTPFSPRCSFFSQSPLLPAG